MVKDLVFDLEKDFVEVIETEIVECKGEKGKCVACSIFIGTAVGVGLFELIRQVVTLFN